MYGGEGLILLRYSNYLSRYSVRLHTSGLGSDFVEPFPRFIVGKLRVAEAAESGEFWA